ncbi:MAG TPA: hypothetical protein VMT67_03120 [Terriglobales bacterium]|nr:hypothetical protein [Terriglobales bacterium]
MISKKNGLVRLICLGAALGACALGMGCVHRAPRYHDDYYNDWHKWNDREMDFYDKWCKETHRDPNVDFARLRPDEQEAYFKWRHDQDKAHYKTPH